VTGASWIGGNGDAYTIKYEANGSFLWCDTVTYAGTNRGRGVAVDHSNNIIVTGHAVTGSNDDMITIKYTPEGTILWIDTLDTGYNDYGRGVAIDSDNNIIVTGFSTIAGNHDYMTVKFDSNGTMLWADTIDYGAWDVAFAVAVDHSDNIIVTGRCEIASYEYLTVKYDPNGTMLWADTVVDGYEAYGVAIDSENSIFVTGVGLSGDYLTIKYDSMGTILWIDTLNNGSSDWGHAIAVDTLDNFIITGTSTINGNAQLFTAKYTIDTKIAELSKINTPVLAFNLFPNPFYERLNITFQASDSDFQPVIDVFDISGRCVRTLFAPGSCFLGPAVITWDGCNETGKRLPTGVYFVAIEAENCREVIKVLLVE